MRRTFFGLLVATGLYITGLAAPSGIQAVERVLCPPAIAAQVPAPPTVDASQDTWVWKDYQDPDEVARAKTPLWQSALWALFKLGFVIALIYAALYGYKRLLGTQAAGALGGRIRVVESTRLSGTQSLLLVEANDRYMLLGSNGAGLLIKLHDWPVDQTAPAPDEAAFARTLAKAEARPDDFQGLIDATIRQVTVRPPEGGA